MTLPTPEEVDPFDLPDTLGTGEVAWTPQTGLNCGHLVRGELRPAAGEPVACDLLAVDQAYPRPVTDDHTRAAAHQAWRHGQVSLVRVDDRLTLLVPGSAFDAGLALEALARLARALGASPSCFVVHLRLG
jgi:hypothetical protein